MDRVICIVALEGRTGPPLQLSFVYATIEHTSGLMPLCKEWSSSECEHKQMVLHGLHQDYIQVLVAARESVPSPFPREQLAMWDCCLLVCNCQLTLKVKNTFDSLLVLPLLCSSHCSL